MSILVDKNTRLVTTGITGSEGTFHTLRNRDYGTKVVAGVTPGKGGQNVDGIPVFNTIRDAVDKQGANTAMIFVPPRFAADSILEAEDAGIELIIAITEGIPAHDELRAYQIIKKNGRSRLIGPNCPGDPLAGQGERRDHSGSVLQEGQRRCRLPLGHADLPGRQRARAAAGSATRRSSASAATRYPAPTSSTSQALPGRPRDRADRDVR